MRSLNVRKLEKFRKVLAEAKIDAALILGELNQRYLTEFAFTDGALLVTQNHAELITDFRYFEAAQKKSGDVYRVSMPDNRQEYISKILSEDCVKTLGFEGSEVSYKVYKGLSEKYQGVDLADIGDMISDMRKIKTPEELSIIQKAQDITDKAFSHLINMITPNMTEIDVAAEIEYSMRKLGAESPAFETIAVSGDASSVPHGTPRNVKLKRGFLTLDYGAKLDGYCSDMTRTVVIGKGDSDMKKLYNTVLSAQKSALEYVREGADSGEADKIARDIIYAIPEYKGTFGHSLGHSLGLFIHEPPNLSPRSFGNKMRVGEVYTVEPGIYLYGKYGCRIEDLVAVEKDGAYNFTHSTKEFIEIY